MASKAALGKMKEAGPKKGPLGKLRYAMPAKSPAK